jgi:hypothetical protein
MASSKRPEPKTSAIPITGRSIFISEAKTQVGSDTADLTKLDIMHMLNEQWDQMDDTMKKKYEKRADYLRRVESRRSSTAEQWTPAPKISAFSVFMRQQHEALKKTNADLTVTDRAVFIADQWKLMSKPDKIPFINAAKRETRTMRRRFPDEESEKSDDSPS